MSLSYAEYEGGQPVSCPHCGWTGPAKELSAGEYHPYSHILDLDCPSCSEHLTHVQFPITSTRLLNEEEDRAYW